MATFFKKVRLIEEELVSNLELKRYGVGAIGVGPKMLFQLIDFK